jgi:kynureninase
MTDLPMRERFDLPEGVVYLDGNSLGPLPRGVRERVAAMVGDEWAAHLVTGWNRDGWMDQPRRVGDRIGRLIGAPPGTVTMGDTLSIKVFQALASALRMRPERRVVLSDSGNFPTDLYMAEGLIEHLDRGHALRVEDPEAVEDAIGPDVAAVMLTHVDYRTGRMHDMAAITRAAHAAGAVMIWDLAHSAGAVPVDLTACGAEFAVGCTYKYLNGGPGAPAFVYVRPDVVDDLSPVLSGWLGHDAPFAFEPSYRPARGVERMRVGTPPVIGMTALEAALDVWDEVDMGEVRARSMALCAALADGVTRRCPALEVIGPADPARRGSQVSFRFEHGYAAIQALIERGVIGDFRAPDVMRFGVTPLYVGEAEIARAVDVIAEVIEGRLWDEPRHHARAAVT